MKLNSYGSVHELPNTDTTHYMAFAFISILLAVVKKSLTLLQFI